jgi:hypothetical protein
MCRCLPGRCTWNCYCYGWAIERARSRWTRRHSGYCRREIQQRVICYCWPRRETGSEIQRGGGRSDCHIPEQSRDPQVAVAISCPSGENLTATTQSSCLNGSSSRSPVVLCMARLEAPGRAKPSPTELGQAGPMGGAHGGSWPGFDILMPAWAGAPRLRPTT